MQWCVAVEIAFVHENEQVIARAADVVLKTHRKGREHIVREEEDY
jgi:3-polyprenyl-4-hydroxybenzoate decarboxylase